MIHLEIGLDTGLDLYHNVSIVIARRKMARCTEYWRAAACCYNNHEGSIHKSIKKMHSNKELSAVIRSPQTELPTMASHQSCHKNLRDPQFCQNRYMRMSCYCNWPYAKIAIIIDIHMHLYLNSWICLNQVAIKVFICESLPPKYPFHLRLGFLSDHFV